MFEQLFVKPHALLRHSTKPLPDERRRFLAHLKEYGLPRVTLKWHAEMLLRVRALTEKNHPGKNRRASDLKRPKKRPEPG